MRTGRKGESRGERLAKVRQEHPASRVGRAEQRMKVVLSGGTLRAWSQQTGV